METKSIRLIEMGVDVESVIRRLGGNEALYLTICSKFIQDPNYHTLKEALLTKDYQSAEIRIHTLKGVAANLGFVRLEIISRSLLQDLRERELTTLYQDVYNLTEEYYRIIKILTEDQQVASQ
jgi:HPt (histidine-containing phosphotransfer) domain-containing protein